MSETVATWWRALIDRPGGPFSFRPSLQPLMARAFAARDVLKRIRLGQGLADRALRAPARPGRPDRAEGTGTPSAPRASCVMSAESEDA